VLDRAPKRLLFVAALAAGSFIAPLGTTAATAAPTHHGHVTKGPASKNNNKNKRNRSRSRSQDDLGSRSTWDLPTALAGMPEHSQKRTLAYEEYARSVEERGLAEARGERVDHAAYDGILAERLRRVRDQSVEQTIEQVRDSYGVPGAQVHDSDSLNQLALDMLSAPQDVRLYVEAKSDLDHRTYSFNLEKRGNQVRIGNAPEQARYHLPTADDPHAMHLDVVPAGSAPFSGAGSFYNVRAVQTG